MQVARSGIVYLVGNLMSAAVPFLLLPLLTRVLPPAEYGAVVNFFILVAACVAIAGLGVHGALSVAWFQKSTDELPAYIGTALGVAISSTLLLAGILYLAVKFWPPSQLGFGPGYAALAALTAGAQVILQCRLLLWQSQRRPTPSIGLQFANSLLNTLLSLAGVFVLSWGALGRISGAAAATLLMGAVAILLVNREGLLRWQPRKTDLRELVTFGGSLVPHVFAGALLTNADRFVVSAMLGSAALGAYGAAAQLGSTMAIIADAFAKAFNPWLFGRLHSVHEVERFVAVGAMYVTIPAFLTLGLAMWLVLHLSGSVILGPEYRSALSILPWFMLGGAFSGVFTAVSGLFFFRARTALLSSISFPLTAVGLCATAALVHVAGIHGGAIGYCLIQGLLALVSWLVASRSFDLPWNEPLRAVRACWHAALRARA